MGLFEGLLIALDLGCSLNFSKKAKVKNKITENGGTISYIVTRKCHFVVTSDPEKCDVSSKCRMAIKYGLPVLKLDYILDSLQRLTLLPYDLYVVGGKSKTLDFKSGKISASMQNEKPKKFSSKTVFNPRIVRMCTANDSNQSWFYEESHEVAKYAIFSGYSSSMKCQCMTIIELHTPPGSNKMAGDKSQQENQLNYRIMLQSGSSKDLEAGNACHTEVRYVTTADQALAVFAMLYEDTEKKPNWAKWHGPVRAIGSKKFQKLMAEMVDVHSSCGDEVKELVEHVWSEAMAEVTSILGNISAIKIEQVEKAEAILGKVREAVKSSSSEKIIEDLIHEFYSTLHHKSESSDVDLLDRRRWLVRKQDMCQLIRDVISVSEMTNYESRAYVEAKYAALRCRITHLTGDKRNEIEELITSSLDGSAGDLTVLNVYEVWRQVEDLDFRHDLEGKQLLFHSSKVENFVGILSRGLLLPKVVVDDFGGKRSDAGMLGSGIYFASAASTSVKYSSPSKIKGSRLLLVNEVALGHSKNYTTHETTLTAPPDGYNSTHGVSRKWDKTSQFENDEFVIYSVNQQRVRYLVEFTVRGDQIKPVEEVLSSDSNILCDAVETASIQDLIGIPDPLSKVKPGLIGTGGGEVELRGVHIRAKLVDLAAQVVVLQEYCNNSPYAIEAKYVFPLEDTAAVCGFEAFINGKHIVGEVKEKEIAHKEYKKAISEGHGAYLMDQDEETPDVFTVSVGNLPPGASVLIKITYVAELQVEEEQISFLLPATVAPWKEESAFKQSTQEELESYKMAASKTTVQVSVEMPFDIRNLHCPTHKIRVKQTASKAFIEMMDYQKFGAGFQLLIGLAEIHVPRMWVERHSVNSDHQACMLTFYPEFETSEVADGEVTIILDTSNSMKGAPLSEAKKVALLVLQNLPLGWNFNVVRFGSDYEELFPAPKAKLESNLQSGINFIQNSVANRGNTDVMWPLRSLFLVPRAETQRNVFLISDGHINNDELVLRCANQNSERTRIFSFGVSATCNSYFLKALSRVSGGTFEFFNIKTKSKWEPKVMRQINKARQPGLASVSVEWQQYDDNLPPPVQAPQQITALFNGSRQVIYGFVQNCTMATLKANIEGQEVSTVVSTSELSVTEGLLVHRLTARAIIRDWEDGVLSKDRTKHELAKMDLKNFIIDLSKEYSIVTQFTSFIAVEKREENEKDLPKNGPSIEELVEKENVDILNYMGWTKLPEDDTITVKSEIRELSKAVTEQDISNKLIHQMGGIEKRYKKLREQEGPCSEDVLNAAKVITDAYCLIGDTDKAVDVSKIAYTEAIYKFSSLVEDPSYPKLADILLDIRDKAFSITGDNFFKSCPVPFPKAAAGKVHINTLEGSLLTIPCQGSLTVGQLKQIIQARDGIPVGLQRLVCSEKQLDDDDKCLEDENIGHGDTVYAYKRYMLRSGEAKSRRKILQSFSEDEKAVEEYKEEDTGVLDPGDTLYAPKRSMGLGVGGAMRHRRIMTDDEVIEMGRQEEDIMCFEAGEVIRASAVLDYDSLYDMGFGIFEEADKTAIAAFEDGSDHDFLVDEAQPIELDIPAQPRELDIPAQPIELDIPAQPIELDIPAQPIELDIPAPSASTQGKLSYHSSDQESSNFEISTRMSEQRPKLCSAVSNALPLEPQKLMMKKRILRTKKCKMITAISQPLYSPTSTSSSMSQPLYSPTSPSYRPTQDLGALTDIRKKIPGSSRGFGMGMSRPSFRARASPALYASSATAVPIPPPPPLNISSPLPLTLPLPHPPPPPLSIAPPSLLQQQSFSLYKKMSHQSLPQQFHKLSSLSSAESLLFAPLLSSLSTPQPPEALNVTASGSERSSTQKPQPRFKRSMLGNDFEGEQQSIASKTEIPPAVQSCGRATSIKPNQQLADAIRFSEYQAPDSGLEYTAISSETEDLIGDFRKLSKSKSKEYWSVRKKRCSASMLSPEKRHLKQSAYATFISHEKDLEERKTLDEQSVALHLKMNIDEKFPDDIIECKGMTTEFESSPLQITSGISSIRTNENHLKLHDLDRLLTYQTEDGCWGLESYLDELLGINSKECLRILMSHGLGSLGKTATEDIKQLVVTFLVLFSIMELIVPEYFPIEDNFIKDLMLSKIKLEEVASKNLKNNGFTEQKISVLFMALKMAFEFCLKIEQKYPVVYSTLELGSSWVNVVTAFMQPHVA